MGHTVTALRTSPSRMRGAIRALPLALLLFMGACNETPVTPVSRLQAPRTPSREFQGEVPSCDPSIMDCSVALQVYAWPSWYTTAAYPDVVTLEFYPSVRKIQLVGTGTVLCSGDYGNLIAFAADSTQIKSVRLELRESCWGPSPGYAYATGATLLSDNVPIAYAKITPMSPLKWALPGVDPQSASQNWWVVAARAVGKQIVVEANGVNGGSFLGGRKRESRITLRAKVADTSLAPSVMWNVRDYPNDQLYSPLPATVPNGASSFFFVPAPTMARWNAPHPRLRESWWTMKALGYAVSAAVRNISSDSVVVRQDSLDTQRQEYIDLAIKQGVPPRSSLKASPYYKKGDYALAVTNRTFDSLLAVLQEKWKPNDFTVTSLYRSPAHNAYHVDPGKSSGTISSSWHQYGCGADMQTQPYVDTTSPPRQKAAARKFWDGLAGAAKNLGLRVEQREQDPTKPKRPWSSVGHVHVEIQCYP
jgi:hypothetical protein